jgi:hypothetical protein
MNDNNTTHEVLTAATFTNHVHAIMHHIMHTEVQNMGRSFAQLKEQVEACLMGEYIDRTSWKDNTQPVDIQALAERTILWFKAIDSVDRAAK